MHFAVDIDGARFADKPIVFLESVWIGRHGTALFTDTAPTHFTAEPAWGVVGNMLDTGLPVLFAAIALECLEWTERTLVFGPGRQLLGLRVQHLHHITDNIVRCVVFVVFVALPNQINVFGTKFQDTGPSSDHIPRRQQRKRGKVLCHVYSHVLGSGIQCHVVFRGQRFVDRQCRDLVGMHQMSKVPAMIGVGHDRRQTLGLLGNVQIQPQPLFVCGVCITLWFILLFGCDTI